VAFRREDSYVMVPKPDVVGSPRPPGMSPMTEREPDRGSPPELDPDAARWSEMADAADARTRETR
jgi:hypothetical protein